MTNFFSQPLRVARYVRIASFALFSAPFLANAAIDSLAGLQGVACTIMSWVFTFALVIGVIGILIAAFKYMTAGGDATKVSEAHKTVTWAAIGIAVALMAAGVPALIGSILGASVPNACP
jgi:hypothetical protein